MKKVMSIVLALAMVLSFSAMFASAAEVNVAETPDPITLSSDNAADIVVDGIGYDLYTIDERMARVVAAPNATADIEIPAIVSYENKNYKVVAIVAGAFTGCVDLNSVTLPNFDGFTIVNLSNGVGIVNGIFTDCVDSQGNAKSVRIYYYLEQGAVSAYIATTDDNVTGYPVDIDKDIDEGIFDLIRNIIRQILEFFKNLFNMNGEQ